jgi:hypothetical protein
MKDFPFQSWMGVPAAVVQVHQWMRHTYNISMPGWEANFVRACSTFCSGFADRESFDLLSGAYETTFQTWRKGAFRQYFNPVHRPVLEGDIYTGTKDGKLYVRDTIGGATSPAGFYRAIVGLLERPAELAAELRTPEKDSVVLSRSEQARKIA